MTLCLKSSTAFVNYLKHDLMRMTKPYNNNIQYICHTAAFTEAIELLSYCY